MRDPYFDRSEVSNSDLTALKKLLYGGNDFDPTHAYAFGTLIDCMITEAEKVDYYNRTVDGESYLYSVEDFERAKRMKTSFNKDEFAQLVLKHASFQHIAIQHDWPILYGGFEFKLNVRCKFDFFFPGWKMGGDIKSTMAETQSQFEAACHHFDYFRSRAWYMDISGTEKDMLIGISKKNFKVFKISLDKNAPIGTKARDLYELGKAQYQELAFKYWLMFDGLKIR